MGFLNCCWGNVPFATKGKNCEIPLETLFVSKSIGFISRSNKLNGEFSSVVMGAVVVDSGKSSPDIDEDSAA